MSVRRVTVLSFTRKTVAAHGKSSHRQSYNEEDEEEEGTAAKKSARKSGVRRKMVKGKKDKKKILKVSNPAKQRDKPMYQQKNPKPRFRDPLPMKMRALPQSFWQQPNLAPSSAPGGSVCALPPLPLPILLEKGSADDQSSKGVLCSGGAAGGEAREREEVVSAANTDLLFSLFRGVERLAAESRRNQAMEEDVARGGRANTEGSGGRADGAVGLPIRQGPPRRGRPRKTTTWATASATGGGAGGVRDDDPCLVSAVADSIRPLLPSQKDSTDGQQVLAMVTLPEADGDVSLPTLDVQHNYSQILSKLVMKL